MMVKKKRWLTRKANRAWHAERIDWAEGSTMQGSCSKIPYQQKMFISRMQVGVVSMGNQLQFLVIVF